MKKSKSKSKLSNEIIIFPNLDKVNHEKPDMEDMANMPKPSRIILCAEPNLGKSNIIKMMLIHADPPFERIVIYHSDPSSKEYNDIDAEYILCCCCFLLFFGFEPPSPKRTWQKT